MPVSAKTFFKRLCVVAQIIAVVFPFSIAHAGPGLLTGLSDALSRNQVSVASNHRIQFTTPTGVDAPSDTITFTFFGGFSFAGMVASDVSLTHGVTGTETQETLAASSAVGVWGVSFSGQTVTLTAPTDALPGEITSGDVVILKLGSATTAHHPTNPTTLDQDKGVIIGGTFGAEGRIQILLVGDDSIGVTATVPGGGPSSGGGGTGPGPGPVSAPAITAFTVGSITQTSAHLLVTTDVATTLTSEYGSTISYGSTGPSDGTAGLSHDVVLSGLSPGSVYHVRVRVVGTGGTTTSSDLAFTTLSAVLPNPPVISALTLIPAENSLLVTWTTDVPARSSLVVSGPTDPSRFVGGSAGLVTSHSIVVSGLVPSTTYTVTASSTAENGLSAHAVGTATTLADTTAPSNPAAFSANFSASAIDLSWVNPDAPDFSHVVIRYSTTHYPTSETDGTAVYSGAGTATSLPDSPSVPTFYFTIFAFDATGNRSSGAITLLSPARGTHPVVLPPPPPVISPPSTTIALGGHTTATTVLPPIIPLHEAATSTSPSVATTTVETATTTTLPVIPSLPAPTSTELIPTTPTSTNAAPVPDVRLALSAMDAMSRITLEPRDGVIQAFVSKSVRILVTLPTGISAQTAVLRLAGHAYLLTPSPTSEGFEATVTLGNRVGDREVASASISTVDGRTLTGSITFQLVSDGIVRTAQTIGSGNVLTGATVTILNDSDGRPWNAPLYGQQNPQVTGLDGRYRWVVPNGSYRIVVEKDGYRRIEQAFRASNHLVGSTIDVQETAKTILTAVLGDSPTVEKIGEVIDVIQSPQNQAVAERVVAPVAATVVVANAATAVNVFNLLNYLRFLITQPLLLFKRRKRERWGVVYNSLTKLPIDLAVVRVIQHPGTRVVQTKITDAKGRYAFQLPRGVYRIEVVKQGYTYPSQLLKGETIDVDFVDLYHSEPIEVSQPTTITPNIPVDPIEHVETPKAVLRKKRFRMIQQFVGAVGVAAAGVGLLISPSWMMAGFFALQSGAYVALRRLAIPSKPSKWGYVKDHSTKRALDRAVVRVFDKKYNKLLETQVTDGSGKYGFIVGKSTYYVVAEKAGYKSFTSEDIDTTKSEGHDVIDKQIALEKA